jgi:hypothetical protein
MFDLVTNVSESIKLDAFELISTLPPNVKTGRVGCSSRVE